MKKLLFILAFSSAISVYGQNAYYDAIELKKFLDGGSGNLKASNPEVFSILDRYIEPSVNNTQLQIIEAVNGNRNGDPNPFIEIGGMIQGDNDKKSTADGKRILSAVGGLDVTNLVDGLAQFLIERAKEELSIAFFDAFKNDLKKLPELRVLFPTTASFLDNIESQNYASFIQTLREGFLADLRSLPAGLRNLRTLTLSDCYGNNPCETRIKDLNNFFTTDENSILFIASTIVMEGLQDGDNLADILKAVVAENQLTKFPDSNITNSLLLADIFSGSLRSNDPNRIWIAMDEFKALHDLPMLRLFFGLVYQEIKNRGIKFSINPPASQLLADLLKPEDINNYLIYLEKVIIRGSEVMALAKEIKEKKTAGEKFTSDDYAQYVGASADLLQTLLNWEPAIQISLQGKAKNLVPIARSSIALYYNVRSADYSSAVSNAFIIIDKSLDDKFRNKDKVLRYGSFMATLILAKNAEDAKHAIESVALPPGSASIKKKSSVNISLNAYLGGFYGKEFVADKVSGNWNETFGVSAPIGIAVSHRIGSASITGYVSIIDIGTVASYRLSDNTTEKLPELKLQNIFAPGGGLVFGFWKVPVSIGFVSQVGPALRKIDASSATVTDKLNRREIWFLSVDIPIVNFYSRPKDK